MIMNAHFSIIYKVDLTNLIATVNNFNVNFQANRTQTIKINFWKWPLYILKYFLLCKNLDIFRIQTLQIKIKLKLIKIVLIFRYRDLK